MLCTQIKNMLLFLTVLLLTGQSHAQKTNSNEDVYIGLKDTPVAFSFVEKNYKGIDLQLKSWNLDQAYFMDNAGLPIPLTTGDTNHAAHSYLYENIYENIDLIVNQENIDRGKINIKFVIFPGANPNQIRFDIEGCKALELLEEGSLQSESNAGWLFMDAPKAHQNYGMEEEVMVKSTYKFDEAGVNVELINYDPINTLTIEFVMEWIPEINGTLPTAFYTDSQI